MRMSEGRRSVGPVAFFTSCDCRLAMLLFLLIPVWRLRVDWASPCIIDLLMFCINALYKLFVNAKRKEGRKERSRMQECETETSLAPPSVAPAFLGRGDVLKEGRRKQD